MQFENIKSQCEGFDTDFNLDEGLEKQKELKQKISTLRANIKSTQSKINAYNKKLQTKADKKNKLKEELLNIQKKV